MDNKPYNLASQAEKEAFTSFGNEVSSSHAVTPVADMSNSSLHWSAKPFVDVSAQDIEYSIQGKKPETPLSPRSAKEAYRELFQLLQLKKEDLKAKAKVEAEAEFTRMLEESKEEIRNTYNVYDWLHKFDKFKNKGFKQAKQNFEADKRYQAAYEVADLKGFYRKYMARLRNKVVAEHQEAEKEFISKRKQSLKTHFPLHSQPGLKPSSTTSNEVSSSSRDVVDEWQVFPSYYGARFYFNEKTRETVFKKPLETMTPLERALVETYPAWEVYTTLSGESYYYNKNANQSQWTIPEEIKMTYEQAQKEALSLVAVSPVTSVLAELRGKSDYTSLSGAPKALDGVSALDTEARDASDSNLSSDNNEKVGCKRSRPHGSDRNISTRAYSPGSNHTKRKKVSQ